MNVDISKISRVFGDRILVRRLERPDKMGGILVPASYMKEKEKEQVMWYGEIEAFGIDSKYYDAYGLQKGDIIGVNDMANSNARFLGTDGNEYCWVMEEFIACRDAGRITSFYGDTHWLLEDCGIIPIGEYSVVRQNDEEEKRGGVVLPKSVANLTGKVLEVSKGKIVNGEITPLNVTKDSEVLFGKYSGLKAKFKNTFLLLIKEEDLIAEFTKEKELANA